MKVNLSSAAQQQLAQLNETVIVRSEYFGFPSARAQANKVAGSENPWLTLHRRQIELKGAGTASFPVVNFDPVQLAWTDEPQAPQVNVNVYSGRRSSGNNLLECDKFQGPVTVAARAPVPLHCRLIAERAD